LKNLFFKKRPKEKGPAKAKNIKYVILGVIFLLALSGIQLAWFFDPITIFVRVFSLSIHPFINNSIDKILIFLLQVLDFPSFLETFYRTIEKNILDVANPVFSQTYVFFLTFIFILFITLLKRRFWCRYICPLGALLAVTARFSLFKRKVYSCKEHCSVCKNVCRMSAIKTDHSYIKEECILCLDCIALCPGESSTFNFRDYKGDSLTTASKGITRSQFLTYLTGSLFFLVGLKNGRKTTYRPVIRPPASLPENDFVQRCIRCGNCMKVCLTNVLQPSLLETGLFGIWTPRFDTNVGYCEYRCTLCGHVCPTGAVMPLTVEKKLKTKLGCASVHKEICIPWSQGKECLVCEEHCPVSEKAIKLSEGKNKDGKPLKLPHVDSSICVGCAICEHKCPVRPYRGITVTPL
jgi:MauM/NapG family ferredoxin protein